MSPHELLLAAKKIFEGIVFDFEFRMKVSETTVSTRFAYIYFTAKVHVHVMRRSC